MAIKTPVLRNAAMTGFIEAAIEQRSFTDATAADYANLVNEAVIFANDVDAVVGAIAAVETGNASFVPASAANTNNLVSYTDLMRSICRAIRAGQYKAPAATSPVGTYTAQANAVNAIFTQAIASQSNA